MKSSMVLLGKDKTLILKALLKILQSHFQNELENETIKEMERVIDGYLEISDFYSRKLRLKMRNAYNIYLVDLEELELVLSLQLMLSKVSFDTSGSAYSEFGRWAGNISDHAINDVLCYYQKKSCGYQEMGAVLGLFIFKILEIIRKDIQLTPCYMILKIYFQMLNKILLKSQLFKIISNNSSKQ